MDYVSDWILVPLILNDANLNVFHISPSLKGLILGTNVVLMFFWKICQLFWCSFWATKSLIETDVSPQLG